MCYSSERPAWAIAAVKFLTPRASARRLTCGIASVTKGDRVEMPVSARWYAVTTKPDNAGVKITPWMTVSD